MDALVAALFAELAKAAPMAVLWILRASGLVPDNAGIDVVEKFRVGAMRVNDIMRDNPMAAAKEARDRSARGILEGVDAWPPEYEKPEGE